MADSVNGSRPRVVLLTSPNLFGATIINRLADEAELSLAGVGLSARIYKNKGFVTSTRTFLQRTGWRYLAYNGLLSSVSWPILRATGRPGGLARSGAQVRAVDDVNSPAMLDWLRSLQPDYVASFYFNQVIGPEVCATARRGCVNMHPSLLPALRGPDPFFRALERGLTTTGLTLHEIAPEIDAGKILHQEQRPIAPGQSVFALTHSLIGDGADVLARWLAGKVASQPPEATMPGAGDYTTFPSPAEVAAFLRSGGRQVRFGEWRRAVAGMR